MKNIVLVTGSVRPGRVADNVLGLVKEDIAGRDDVEATVADLQDLALPFFDSEKIPADPEFAPTDENVQKWTQMVADADGVVFVMPEYNHSLSAVQKNAMDWIFGEWQNKPVALVGYGWSGGSLAIEAAKPVLENLKVKLGAQPAKLQFMQQLNPDGTVADEETTRTAIRTAVDEIVEA